MFHVVGFESGVVVTSRANWDRPDAVGMNDDLPAMIVGGYPAAPSGAMSRAEEARFWRALLDDPRVQGLEIPFMTGLHADEGWFRGVLPTGGGHVVTAIPATAMRGRENPRFGLASTDPAGRRAALELAEDVRRAVGRLVDNGAAVLAVELHSAPSRVSDPAAGGAEPLADSMAELLGREWFGAELVIEHCDAPRPGQPAQKGYLDLADELAAVIAVGDSVGLVINWARSVIEGRDSGTAVDHVRSVAAAGRLSGVMFSGVADGRDGDWLDAHLPPAESGADSLLTVQEMRRTLQPLKVPQADAKPPRFIGAKIAARPGDLTWRDRAEGVLKVVDHVRAAWLAPAPPLTGAAQSDMESGGQAKKGRS